MTGPVEFADEQLASYDAVADGTDTVTAPDA